MLFSNSLKSTLLAIGHLSLALATVAFAQDTDKNAGQGNSSAGQALPAAPAPAASQSSSPAQPQTQPQPPSSTQSSQASQREKAQQQLKAEEKQRVIGIVPIFNVTYLGQQTVPLTVGQKFDLAFHSSIDPFTFLAAATDAAISQAQNEFPGYGQGWLGYGKRVGASYADSVDGTMIGNAVLPALLHQDPRYFRMGTGTFTHRLLYSISTTVWCRNDNGKWGPNYSNVAGNLIAGGISNLYYPSTDRGVGLTFQRGFTVTAEGTIGAVFNEFWPDIANRIFKQHFTQFRPEPPTSSTPQTMPQSH